ncbi:MAG: hypothetical protein ACYC1K_02290 [Minisyncoccota bacterium]
MKSTETEVLWQERLETEIEAIKTAASTLGYVLDKEQPHISGERFLMTRNKLVLMGQDKSGKKIVIKASDHPDGKKEIRYEKNARDLLQSVSFAQQALLFPRELYFGEIGEYLMYVTEYIAQEKVFVEHPLEQQFFMALKAFEAQEAFHATTFEHVKKVGIVFPIFTARTYFESFDEFQKSVSDLDEDGILEDVLAQAEKFLKEHKSTIDTYSNHLVHTDFVPHNFRVSGQKMYMLDAAAVQFGNKYEGWARFLNYMVIHNPDLEKLLTEYVRTNRGEVEYLNLRLMRVYKIGYLINYYISSLSKTSGDLHELTKKRIAFWHRVLEHILEDKALPREFIDEYKGKRDTLRSEEEKERQKEFAVA